MLITKAKRAIKKKGVYECLWEKGSSSSSRSSIVRPARAAYVSSSAALGTVVREHGICHQTTTKHIDTHTHTQTHT